MIISRAALLLCAFALSGFGEEFRQPQLAVGYGHIGITYGSGPNIYFSASLDGGKTFAEPVKVATTGALALGRHRGPRLTILKESLLITAVAGKKVSEDTHAHGLPEAGDLLTWRSLDGGKTWVAAKVINDVPGAAREGLHAITADKQGKLYAAWLDLRDKGTKLYGATSLDGGTSWSKNVLIYESPDGTICQCCDPALTVDDHGVVTVMWRNVLAGNRDLYISQSKDGAKFSAAVKLGEGSWQLNACPMDGGGIVPINGKLVSAWRRGTDLYVAEAGAKEQLLGAGKDIAIAATPKGAALAWSGANGIEARLPTSDKVISVSKSGGFPALATLPDGSALAAWEDAGKIHTQILR